MAEYITNNMQISTDSDREDSDEENNEKKNDVELLLF